ncbi:dihydroorotase [Urechidicola sp. KH5]
MNALIKSATIVDKLSQYHLKKQDILIENGIIAKIADSIKNPNNYSEINLPNLMVSAGWFDTSVSFGEPGYEERETIANGLTVAAKSGFTDVAVNGNTKPATDNLTAVQFLINKASGYATNLHPIGCLTVKSDGYDLAELYDMKQFGAIAFGDYKKPISNANLLKIALQYTQNFDGLVQSFPQDSSIAREGLANEGVNSTVLGLKGIPALAETMQVARDIFLLEYAGGKLHIPTISTKKSVELIKEAKNKGLDISCSVSANHLTITDEMLHGFNANTKVTPPLRTKEDIYALIAGVKDGTIDIITSDHNPMDVEHKKVAYSAAKFGSLGLESLIGSLNTVLSVEDFIETITRKPRERFNLKPVSVSEGLEAKLSLFTAEGEDKFTENQILSTSKNSAYLGQPTKGKAYGIIANNQIVLNQ